MTDVEWFDNRNAFTIVEPPVLPTCIKYICGYIGGHDDDDVIVSFVGAEVAIGALLIVLLCRRRRCHCCWCRCLYLMIVDGVFLLVIGGE